MKFRSPKGAGWNSTAQARWLVGPNLLAKGEQTVFALGDCASLVPEGAGRPLPSTAQVANQQALHLIRYLPAWLLQGKPVPPFRFRDLGALVSLQRLRDAGAFRIVQGRLHQRPLRAAEPRRALPPAPALVTRPMARHAAVACGADQRSGAAQNPHQLKSEQECVSGDRGIRTDHGRAINQQKPGWEDTLTGVPREIYQLWYKYFRPRGYKLRVEVVDWPGGMPGEIGMTLSW